jgi:hypothetical protein
MDSNENINDMAEAVGTMALEYGEDNGLSANEMINAMVVTTVIMSFALKKDDADLVKLKATLVEAVAAIFDQTLGFSNEKA